MITVAFFCIAVELRSLKENNPLLISKISITPQSKSSTDNLGKIRFTKIIKGLSINNNNPQSPTSGPKDLNSEYYHATAVELSCIFLPGNSPIAKHYVNNYNKHYGLNLQPLSDNTTYHREITLTNFNTYTESSKIIFIKSSLKSFEKKKISHMPLEKHRSHASLGILDKVRKNSSMYSIFIVVTKYMYSI